MPGTPGARTLKNWFDHVILITQKNSKIEIKWIIKNKMKYVRGVESAVFQFHFEFLSASVIND